MIQYNVAFVYGTGGSISYLLQAVPGNSNPLSINLQDQSDNLFGKNEAGATKMVKVTNRRRTCVVEFAIIGTSRAQARAGHKLPSAGAMIYLYNWEAPDMNGYWTYWGGGSVTFSQGRVGTITLPLTQFEDMESRKIAKIAVEV